MTHSDPADRNAVRATLEECRQTIHEAAGYSQSDRYRSTQAAHHALTLANTVLLEPAATPTQREYAGYYQADALALQEPRTSAAAARPFAAATSSPSLGVGR